MSIHQPPADWFKAPDSTERLWVGLALIWCLVMFIAMPYWYFYGKQNSVGEGYLVEPMEFSQRVSKFVETNKVGELKGIPIVEAAPGGDVYLQAMMWSWFPVIQMRKDQTYRLHISSLDLQHGFSIQPLNMNFQILPGYDHVLTITPTSAGEFSIVCNEFCGIGHHLMTGRILVVE
ncbi:MAG: cytochrome c oxidase subunit II [bacterium]|nr:cytochrome c oxidase subunit II [bacterium]